MAVVAGQVVASVAQHVAQLRSQAAVLPHSHLQRLEQALLQGKAASARGSVRQGVSVRGCPSGGVS